MAERCEPKQNDCTKAGVGPSCQEAKYGGPAKARCLEIVKENCEEQREQCIQQCIDTKVAAFQAARAAEDARLAAAREAAAKALTDCQKTKPYLDIYGEDYNIGQNLGPGSTGLRLLYRKIASQGDLYRALTGKNPVDGSAVSEQEIKAIQATRPAAYWANLTAQGVLNAYFELQAEARDKERKLKAICPSSVIPDDTRDICKMEQEENGDIADCISQCWYNSLTDCDTRHCMCGSYKCEGPTMSSVGLSSPDEPDVANIVVTEGQARDSKFDITLSQYGVPIQLLYGREFLFGNVVWMGDVNEVRSYTTTVTFDPIKNINTTKQTLDIDNYLSFHVGLCAGPVDAISRVWLEGGLIYDKYASSPVTIESQDRLRVRVFTGEESSKVDATQAEAIGFGRVPAYRGMAGAFIENINISDLRQFPNLRFEVIKEIADTVPTIESAAYTLTGEVFYDLPHRRVLAQTNLGVRVLNYDTLASVALLDVQDFATPTAFPNLLSYDGDALSLYDPNHGDLISSLDISNAAEFTFIFRYVDESNAGYQLAGVMLGDDLTLYTVNDMSGEIAQWSTPVLNILGGPATTATPLLMDRATITSNEIEAGAYSLFLARAATDRLQIADLMCFNTDQHDVGAALAYPQLDAGTFGSYELEFDTSDLTLLGTLACARDKTLVFFVEYDGVYEIVKWHPDNGVTWRTEVASLPDFGKYSPTRPNIGRIFTFVDTTGTAVNLDLDTGGAIEGATGNPIPSSPQVYDDQLGAVTYYSTDGTFIRVFADRINEAATSVADIIRDIADRADIDRSHIYTADVEGVEIIGFRSSTFIRGTDILTSLFNVYPTTSFSDNQIIFIRKGTAATHTPSEDDLAYPVEIARRDEAHDLKSVTVTYDSTATDNTAQQAFSLPDDPFEGRQAIAYDLPALLDDDYARSLAELITFAGQENDVVSAFELPPRYLAITPSDIVTLTGSWRIRSVETGWDLSSRFEGYSDAVEKYNNLATITGVAGFSRFSRDTTQKPCASLVALPMRTIFPRTVYSGTVFFGLADVFGTFEEGAVVSMTDDEFSNSPGQQSAEFPEPLVYGRLITPPAACSNPLTSQIGASMVIKMASPEMVDRLSFSQIVDLYSAPFTCLILVGQELIQYSYFEVDPDGVTVTFYDLLRARHFTEGSMDHTAGEIAVVYSIGGVKESFEFGGHFYEHKKFINTATPDASTRLDANFSRDAAYVFTDTGAFHPLRRDYPGDGILIHVDRTDLIAYPFPDFTWSPDLDEQSMEIWLLRQPYDAVTFALWRQTFDFTDFSYVLTWGDNTEQFFADPDPFFKLFGLLFTESEQSSAGFDPTTETIYAVLIRGGLNIDTPETITVAAFEPRMDYARFVGGTNVS